jgi:hypothetical protein
MDKPQDVVEFQEDAADYLLGGKIKKYEKSFEKKSYKISQMFDLE